jgi:hypothetical protein
MRLKLTEKHPHYKKLEQLFKIMDEQKICFAVPSGNPIVVYIEGIRYDLIDLESPQSISDVPPTFEYKMVFDKP